MWNRSERWQRTARIAAGVVVVALLLAGSWGAARTEAARRAWDGTRDLLIQLRAPNEQTIRVAVPASLGTRPGTLVYLDRPDGAAQIVGQVTQVESLDEKHQTLTIRLTQLDAHAGQPRGVLLGAGPTIDLEQTMRLLVRPDTPDDELRRARDLIWPSVREHVLPNLTDRMLAVVSAELAKPQDNTQVLVSESVRRVREALGPLVDELVERLADRAAEVIGVKGVATGVWRTTSDGIRNSGRAVADWWWQLFGSDTQREQIDRPFLSDKTRAELAAAMEDETGRFWRERRSAIVDVLVAVAHERRPEFEAAFREHWGGLLYERAVLPAWTAGQEQVVAAMQDYANDFAARRLLTPAGGPRLLLAHALRSSLDVSDSPLLIFSPAAGSSGDGVSIIYQPLVP